MGKVIRSFRELESYQVAFAFQQMVFERSLHENSNRFNHWSRCMELMNTDKSTVPWAPNESGWRENISVNQSSSVVQKIAAERLFRRALLQEEAEKAEVGGCMFFPMFQQNFPSTP